VEHGEREHTPSFTASAGAVLAALALALTGCKAEPLRIGLVSGLSGRHSDLGLSSRNGATLAVEELNAAGGIGGRPVELVVRDDAQDPEVARRAVEELIGLGVVALVGNATSAMTEVSLPVVNRARVLMVSPTASASAFRGRDDWLVMLYPSTAEAAHVLAEHLSRTRAPRALGVVWDRSNAAFSGSWKGHFQEEARRRGWTLREHAFTSGQVESWAAIARAQLAAPRVDGVLVVANALDTAALAQQLRKLGEVPLYGTDWGFTPEVLAHGGQAIEGARFTHKVNPEDRSPRFLRFQDAYRARFNRPVDFAAVFSWEAVMVLAEGLRRDPTREGVRRAVLEARVFPGLQGDFTIDPNGDVARRHYVLEVRGGRMAVVE
jgi:branched-chain amino acid transport system substrate-binding protein